jgi:hypothetical protein
MATTFMTAIIIIIILYFLTCASHVVVIRASSSYSSLSSQFSSSPPPQQQHIFSNDNDRNNNNSNNNIYHEKRKVMLVVGSANVDTFLPVMRLPSEGENLTTQRPPTVDIPGGKGCTQAVAASKLVRMTTSSMAVEEQSEWFVRFVGQFGLQQDSGTAAHILRETLHQIDDRYCGVHQDLPCGRGYVFLTETGSVSAVVSGGSNQHGWQRWKEAWKKYHHHHNDIMDDNIRQELNTILQGVQCILLQREVPEYVSLLMAKYAKSIDPTIITCQDVGGEDRPIS